MNLPLFRKTLQGMKSDANAFRLLTGVLSLCILLSLVLLSAKSTTTVLIPPSINEKMEISTSKASAGYKKSWGLFVSQLVGNISNSNAQFVMDSLESIVKPDVYATMKKGIISDIELIKQNALIINFDTKGVIYEVETGKVFVIGNASINGYGPGQRLSFDKTFEMEFEIQNGMPLIKYFDTYKGEARTLEYKKKYFIQ